MQAALRAPSAGNTGGTAWVILEGPAETALYWEATTDEAWRSTSARWPGLRRAPVILLAYASAEAYVARYAEADKAESGRGRCSLGPIRPVTKCPDRLSASMQPSGPSPTGSAMPPSAS